MLVYNLTALPWTFLRYDQQPKKKFFEEYGCFAFGTNVARLKLPVYCQKHKVTEVLERHYSQLAWLSLTRPSEEEWLQCISKTTTRSHFCHLSVYENPFHSVQEGQKENADWKQCYTKACKLMADSGMTAPEAATFARDQCPHTPKCWPTSSLPGVTP
jgi:hypothetical protein